jgi:hypothetical protein
MAAILASADEVLVRVLAVVGIALENGEVRHFASGSRIVETIKKVNSEPKPMTMKTAFQP